jgi:hypothetical protein
MIIIMIEILINKKNYLKNKVSLNIKCKPKINSLIKFMSQLGPCKITLNKPVQWY